MRDAQQIAIWADQLRDIAATGLRWSKSKYDDVRYTTLQNISMEMLATATDEPTEEMEPLRATVFSHVTPFSTGDAGVVDEEGRILLIKRADNHRWAMPGGAFEVGETPAEGAEREAFEETGIRCKSVALVGVFDSRFCGTTSRHQLYQFTFLCEPIEGDNQEASHAEEVEDVQWFARERIPENLDPGHVSRIPEVFRVWNGDRRAFFI